MSRNTLLWFVPIFLTMHNLEEAVFMPAFLEKSNSSIPNSLREVVPQVTYKQFLVSLLIVTVIPYLIALLGRDSMTSVYLLLAFQVVMLINVFAHSLMALFLGGYAPGLVSALAINLPFSLYLLRRALVENWLSGRAIALMFPLGLLIHGPVLIGLIIFSGQIASRL